MQQISKLWIIALVGIFQSICSAQTPEVERIIDSYIVYIQDTNATEAFLPETIHKTLDIQGEKIDHDITYFSLNSNQLFSVIVQSYGEPEVKTTYYYKDNQVIAVFIEENNFSSNPKDKKFRNYFLKDNEIILEEPINSSDDYKFFIFLGKGLVDNFLRNK